MHFLSLVFIQAVYAMEINVEKDKQTGETKILSTSTIGPEGVHQRGVKVFDDGTKVVYEVHSGSTIVENGVHKLSSKDVEELIQKAGQSSLRGGHVSERTVIADGSLSHPKEHMLCKEAKLEMVHKSRKDHSSGNPGQQAPAPSTEGPEANLDQPVTMIFMGYQNIEDEEETKKVLGYDETIKAELVLIDEDDEKSLREKTVTDVSTIDGNAAELVSGRLISDTTEPSSPEGKEESLATEPAPGTQKKKRCQCCVVMWLLLSSLFFWAASVLSTTYVDLTVPLTAILWTGSKHLPCLAVGLLWSLLFFSLSFFSSFLSSETTCMCVLHSFQELTFPLNLSLCLQEGIGSLLLNWNGLFTSASDLVALIHLNGTETVGTRGFILSCVLSRSHTSPRHWFLTCRPCCGSLLLYLVWQNAMGSSWLLV